MTKIRLPLGGMDATSGVLDVDGTSWVLSHLGAASMYDQKAGLIQPGMQATSNKLLCLDSTAPMEPVSSVLRL